MHKSLLLNVFALAATSGAVAHQAPAANAAPATQFVRNFFHAFDDRDIPRIRAAFIPTATIVHDDGVEQTVPQLIDAVSSANHWYPRTRKIDCDVKESGKIVVVGCFNNVTFKRPDGAQKTVAYNETWVLRHTEAGLKAVRTHYSRIRKSAHSE